MLLLTKICLLIILLGIVFVQRNYAATKLLYSFSIRDPHSERNETAIIKDTNDTDDDGDGNDDGHEGSGEIIVTGRRNTDYVHTINSIPQSVFSENTIYRADKNGYHVSYNFSIRTPIALEPRLSGMSLKVITG